MARARSTPDRCPGALSLHEAQDGWLARVRVPGGRLSAAQVSALARAAALGNGLVDLTSRANVQVRGLPADAGVELARLLRECGLLRSDAHDRVRNVTASPLAGRHPSSVASTDAVVEELDARLCEDPALAELPGRFLFAVDDGSGLALGQTADVALVARDPQTFVLALAGWTTAVETSLAAAAAVAAARAFLALRGEAWRVADLPDGAAAVARRLATCLVAPVPRPAALGVGWLEQRDGRGALTALAPLGRLEAHALAALGDIRISTERTITLVDQDTHAAEGRLRALGLVTEDGSGWTGLTACAGLGRCAKARADVRAAAAVRARARRPGDPAEHWTACERRCGERAGQPVAVSACAGGVVVRRGDEERVVVGVPEALAVLA